MKGWQNFQETLNFPIPLCPSGLITVRLYTPIGTWEEIVSEPEILLGGVIFRSDKGIFTSFRERNTDAPGEKSSPMILTVMVVPFLALSGEIFEICNGLHRRVNPWGRKQERPSGLVIVTS